MSGKTRNVRRLQAEMPMMSAGMVLVHAETIIDMISRRDVGHPRDAYVDRIADAARELLIEARALQRTAALLTDYDAAHELLRKEDG